MFEVSRRHFIGASAGILLSSNAALAVEQSKNQKACLLIYLHGGASHLELGHAGKGLPEGYNSVTGVIQTKAGGLGGTFEELAKRSHLITNVQSFAHRDANHGSAAAWVLSGTPDLPLTEETPMREPSYGSIVSYLHGTNTEVGLPIYNKVDKIAFGMGGVGRRDGNGWLEAKHTGFDCDAQGIANLNFGEGKERIDRRMKLVESMDRKDTANERAWTQIRRQAYTVAVGNASEAFDLTKEPLEVQTRFKAGTEGFGKSLLMARRLIQRGAKFVNVTIGGWDMHNDISPAFTARGKELDWGLSLILDDLESSGILDSTLVIITTEFGRTKYNINRGRDHWNQTIPLIFAGGGYEHGRTIGETSKTHMEVHSNPFTPADLSATVMEHFGVARHVVINDPMKRPHHVYKDGAKNILL